MTVGELLRKTTGNELYDILEYDALYPPLNRNDLEDFFAILVAKIHNAHMTNRTTPEEQFPALRERKVWQSKIHDKIRNAARKRGKPLQLDLDEENRKRAEAIRLEAYMSRLARKGIPPGARGTNPGNRPGDIR
jgi:hypothetical protein